MNASNSLQSLACQVACQIPGNLFVPALVGLFAQLAGVSVNSLQALAQSIQGQLSTAQLLPALVGLAQLIQQGGVSASTAVYGGTGSPVGVLTPTVATAIYFDNSILGQPAMWVWQNSLWTELIAN